MRKKLIKVLLIGFIMCCFVGCDNLKLTNSETVTDYIKVENVNCTGGYTVTNMIYTGKTFIPISSYIPKSYIVKVNYKGTSIKINNKDIYHKLIDEVGNTVKCDMIINEFKDGHIEIEILKVLVKE